jgi:sterol desaturase/sphingolipid hydroxylase (fatty acid hydroxylase superfamily)
MVDWILENEVTVRLSAFLGVLAVMVLWELVAERKERSQARPARWLANLGISVIDSFVARLVLPVAAVGVAYIVAERGWGLLNYFELPQVATFVVSMLVLDLSIYFQHVMFHAVPALWRLHMVHHTDQDLDATSGIRFHPVEIILSLLIKFAVIAAIGTPPFAVLVFEVVLNATSIFNHGNVRLPLGLDRLLRLIVVTPDMHRVHHSVEIDESNSNFGFNLPWWDRLFGTYRAQPKLGHEGMVLGVEHLQRAKPIGLLELLGLPLTKRTGRYPIGQRDSSESK